MRRDGLDGLDGKQGPRGEKGERGLVGLEGKRGPAGLAGERGERGSVGKAGPEGKAGERGPRGSDGDTGWSPILAVVADGERRVHQVAGWTGGEGPMPESGWYIGPGGPVGSVADAVDLRGQKGPAGETRVAGGVGSTGPAGEDAAAEFKTGFPNRTDSQLDFDSGTRTFTVEPVASDFSTFTAGVEAVYSTAQTVVVPDTSGPAFIYFDSATGAISQLASFDVSLITTHVYIANIWWDADGSASVTTDPLVLGGDERHGCVMDHDTHLHFHTTLRAQYVTDGGLALLNITADGNGASNSHAQFGFSAGAFRDEDIRHDISAQSLPATLDIVFFENGDPKRVTGDSYPVIYAGKGGWSGTLIAYQGASGLLEAANNSYVLMHVFACNDWRTDKQMIAVVGGSYSTRPAAQAAANTEINSLTDLPWPEFIRIGTVIYQTRTSDSNAPKCHIVSTEDGSDYIDWRQAAGPGVGSTASNQEIFSEATAPAVTYPAINFLDVVGYSGLKRMQVNG